MKKILSILLTFVMVFSFVGMSASAETYSGRGSIVVNNYNEEVTISIYKMMDLANYDADAGTYPYVINTDWTDFFTRGEGANYINIDSVSKAITWNGEETEERIAEFAKEALEYATTNSVDPVKIANKTSTDADIEKGQSSVTFKNLDLGYYLVDSTMGALCGLTTTNPDGVINAKNGIPIIDKQVQEDLTGQWGETNTCDIGQSVDFRVTINVHAGAQKYILEDNMGQKFNFGSIKKVELITSSGTITYKANPAADEKHINEVIEKIEGAEESTEYLNQTGKFQIYFKESFCEELKTNDKVVVYYDGMLNRDAIVGEKNVENDIDGNKNSAKLYFGEVHQSNEDYTVTYTFGIDLIKTDHNNALLDGAKFRIYDAAENGNEIKVVELERDTEGNITKYRRARSNEVGEEIIVKNGKVRIDGLDNGTYYLEETVAPATYNKLETRQSFTISDKDLDATFTNEVYSKGSGVQVINKTGVMLPETGGMGTTLFVSLGAVVVLGTGVLLVTKKRMSMIDD